MKNDKLSGNTEMLVLNLLNEKDMYGYEIIATLRQRSENVFDLKTGTLYPLLHQLEKKKYLKAYEQEVGGKVRKYYSITALGRAFVKEKELQWKVYMKACSYLRECFSGKSSRSCRNRRVSINCKENSLKRGRSYEERQRTQIISHQHGDNRNDVYWDILSLAGLSQ